MNACHMSNVVVGKDFNLMRIYLQKNQANEFKEYIKGIFI